MKKIIIYISTIFLYLTLASCQKQEVILEDLPFGPLDENSGTIVFTWKGEKTETFSFTSPSDWTLQTDVEWISCSSEAGSKGLHEIVLDAEANESGMPREGRLTLTSAADEIKIPVYQSSETGFVVAKKEYSFPQQGGTFEVRLLSEKVAVRHLPEWIVLQENTDKEGSSFIFQVNAGDGYSRTGTIVFECAGEEQFVRVVQTGRPGKMHLSYNVVYLPPQSETSPDNMAFLYYTCAEKAELDLKNLPSWLYVDYHQFSTGTGRVVFHVSDNPSPSQRSAVLELTDPATGVQGKMTVVQYANGALELPKKVIFLSEAAQSFDVMLTSNVDLPDISCDVTWITRSEEKTDPAVKGLILKDPETRTLRYKVSENTGENRIGRLTIGNYEQNVSEIFQVVQYGPLYALDPALVTILLSNGADKNPDGILDQDELAAVEKLTIDRPVSSLSGLDRMAGLKFLHFRGNTCSEKLIDLSKNTKLQTLLIDEDNSFQTLKLPDANALEKIGIIGNSANPPEVIFGKQEKVKDLEMTCVTPVGVDFSDFKELIHLSLNNCNLDNLELDASRALKKVRVESCKILSKFSITACPLLEEAVLNRNEVLGRASLVGNPVLQKLMLIDNPQLVSVSVSECPKLAGFLCQGQKVIELDMVVPDSIRFFVFQGNSTNLDYLDFSGKSLLEIVMLHSFAKSNLDFSDCPKLGQVSLDYNHSLDNVHVDLSGSPELTYLKCKDCLLKELDISNNPKLNTLNAESNSFKEIKVWKDFDPGMMAISVDDGVTFVKPVN